MSQGTIVQVIGAVVDVEFPRGSVPKIYDALKIAGTAITLEVQQQLGDGVVRTIALGSTDGLKRGLTVDNTGVSPNPAVGEIGTSKKQYQFSGNWLGKGLGLNLSANYQGSAAFNVLDAPETRDILRVDSYWLLNGGVSYKFGDNIMARLAVTNLLDEEPPFPSYGAGIGNYDILGRRYNLSFEWKY